MKTAKRKPWRSAIPRWAPLALAVGVLTFGTTGSARAGVVFDTGQLNPPRTNLNFPNTLSANSQPYFLNGTGNITPPTTGPVQGYTNNQHTPPLVNFNGYTGTTQDFLHTQANGTAYIVAGDGVTPLTTMNVLTATAQPGFGFKGIDFQVDYVNETISGSPQVTLIAYDVNGKYLGQQSFTPPNYTGQDPYQIYTDDGSLLGTVVVETGAGLHIDSVQQWDLKGDQGLYATPEPATIASAFVALPLIGGYLWRRNRRARTQA